jgi:hypothetical protein
MVEGGRRFTLAIMIRASRRLVAFSALLLLALLPSSALGAVTLQPLGTFANPTYLTSEPNDASRLFIVERAGRIKLLQGGNVSTFLDIEPLVLSPPNDVGASGEQGMASMAFSPDYATDHLFYVAYSLADDPATEGVNEAGDFRIDEFTADGDAADPTSRREVLTIDHSSDKHYAGQLQFGPDGYLYISTGDNNAALGAQNTGRLVGKILRIDPAGSAPGEYGVPADNPFTGTSGCADGCDEVWSYGLRNPWRFSFDRATGNLTIADVGQDSWEEVNVETGADPGKGDNFGWPCREGMHDFSTSMACDVPRIYTEPVFEYGHVDGGVCSITGGYVVRDTSLGDLYGRYLYGDFCTGGLRSLDLGPPVIDRSESLTVRGVTSFGEDASCRIYVVALSGAVHRLTQPGSPGACPPDTTITAGPGEGENTDDATPTFAFESDTETVTFECSLDGEPFDACSSPFTTEQLADGSHSFAVRAIDANENIDPSPAERSFTVGADADDDGTPDTSDACPAVSGPTPSGCPTFNRALTVDYSRRGDAFKGELTGGPGECITDQRIAIRRVRRGPDPKVSSDTTNENGRYKASKSVSSGRYYATTNEVTVATAGVCSAAKSRRISP